LQHSAVDEMQSSERIVIVTNGIQVYNSQNICKLKQILEHELVFLTAANHNDCMENENCSELFLIDFLLNWHLLILCNLSEPVFQTFAVSTGLVEKFRCLE
jgi:hypothetical protein